AEGGPALILTWHAFALAALALVPLALALSVDRRRMAETPGLAIAAASFGALAGLTQAVGLWRWVFVVPTLARIQADPASTAEDQAAAARAFEVLNLYGGVAIGEHLGQWLTVFFVASLSMLQWREGSRITSGLGGATALVIAVGTTEGLAIALGRSGDPFALFTIAGFLLLTLWLMATGVGLARGRRAPA
ncbi:DUF4386 family protein, partial [Aphanothece microscopica]|uniref:DUF4386 family protein n=1 Tax=Aphanothece microscopica TaxID=1049561 RepID=UPI003985203E